MFGRATRNLSSILTFGLDGKTQYLRWELRPWHTTEGEIGGITIFAEDISERAVAELALRESQMAFSLPVRQVFFTVA